MRTLYVFISILFALPCFLLGADLEVGDRVYVGTGVTAAGTSNSVERGVYTVGFIGPDYVTVSSGNRTHDLAKEQFVPLLRANEQVAPSVALQKSEEVQEAKEIGWEWSAPSRTPQLSSGSRVIIEHEAPTVGGRTTLTGGIWTVRQVLDNGNILVNARAGTLEVRPTHFSPVLTNRPFNQVVMSNSARPRRTDRTLSGGVWNVQAVDMRGNIVVEIANGTQLVVQPSAYAPIVSSNLRQVLLSTSTSVRGSGGQTRLRSGIWNVVGVDASNRIGLRTADSTVTLDSNQYIKVLPNGDGNVKTNDWVIVRNRTQSSSRADTTLGGIQWQVRAVGEGGYILLRNVNDIELVLRKNQYETLAPTSDAAVRNGARVVLPRVTTPMDTTDTLSAGEWNIRRIDRTGRVMVRSQSNENYLLRPNQYTPADGCARYFDGLGTW